MPTIDETSTLDPDQTASSPSPPPSVGESIAATAAKLAGANSAAVKSFLKQTGQTLDPTQANWCAAFVNGVLGANGVPGTTGPSRNVATGFLNWGVPADGEPQPGDVMVLPRGHPAGATGGHVGIAVGQVSEGKSGTFYLMQSGNLSDKVQYTWEPAGSVVVRRAPPQQQQGGQ